MPTKPVSELTLRDRLSRLTLTQANQLLGARCKKLLAEGGSYDIDPELHVLQGEESWVVTVPGAGPGGSARVTLSLDPAHQNRLALACEICPAKCCHLGAALSLILEEKTALGLAIPPEEYEPIESLKESELVALALKERQARAENEKMRLRSRDPSTPWADYTLTSAESGKSYRLALRGWEPGESFCSCPDFRKNTLGTCKHILNALAKARRRFSAAKRNQPFRPADFFVHLRYGTELELRFVTPVKPPPGTPEITRSLVGKNLEGPQRLRRLLRAVQQLEAMGHAVTIYPDAEEHIHRILHRQRIARTVNSIRKNPARHPLRKELIKADLLPYQLEGIAFAAGAGRAILADDMGLGKTIQGIGVAELLAREAGIQRVLIVCPASLKSQWFAEINRFSARPTQLVLGSAAERAAQYPGEAFFTICNYEQVLRDLQSIERVPWDLIILDEGQRIKNWEAKTSHTVKALRSPYALVLTGTPIENRIDDIYSILEFIDDRRLGPAFRFFNRHRVVDERGKVLGYKNLSHLRKQLAPVLLRRTRDSVLQQLPPRTTEVVRVQPTDEQLDIDGAQMQVVGSILSKRFFTEMDILRLKKALLLARMAADSTYLVNKLAPGFSSKLERLRELLWTLSAEEGRKIVLFSEWTTMLGLIEKPLEEIGLPYVRLDGSIPQKQRQKLVHRFQRDAACKLFITTNAGSLGLNLQAANTVINVDLPWNPAILEQRIGRAHRMGQKRPVHVVILISEGTIEEKILSCLSAKHDLALAVLDQESSLDKVDLHSGIEELKRRLEVLLGAKGEAPTDESEQLRLEEEAKALTTRKQRISDAGGQLLTAAFGFLAEMLPQPQAGAANPKAASRVKESLAQCIESGEDGRPRLTVTLPDQDAIDKLAATLAQLMPER